MKTLPAFRGYIFDLDGTVYRGDRLVAGAAETIRGLRAAKRRIVFLSNKPIDTREAYARKLRHLGIPTKPGDVINSSHVLSRYLGARCPHARLFVIGERPLLAELRRAGFRITMGRDAKMATALVLTGVTDRQALRRSATKPDFVLSDLRQLLSRGRASRRAISRKDTMRR